MDYPMTFEQMAEALRGSQKYRVLDKFEGAIKFGKGTGARKIGLILDTETTGKDNPPGKKPGVQDQIIELGMVKFAYDPDNGDILEILGTFSGFEDPGMPIPEEATAVNGITDDMVAGHRLNDDEIAQFVSDVQLVIAHNSQFDRQYVEERLPIFKQLPWVCSFRQIDWLAEGITSAKLEYIATVLGFYYDAHRATNDCFALLRVLQEVGPVSLEPFMLQLDRAQHKLYYRVWADNSRFEMKDTLKENKFRWFEQANFIDGVFKAWYIDIEEDKLEEQLTWLRTNVYFGKSVNVTVQELDAYSNFSRRVTRNGIRAV